MRARGIRDGINVEDVTVAVAGVAVEVGVVGVEMSANIVNSHTNYQCIAETHVCESDY